MGSPDLAGNGNLPPLTPARALAMVALVVAALWLGWKAWEVNITMSCWKDEWPQLAVCGDIMGRTPEEKVAKLRQRLAENPGDSEALVSLAIWASPPKPMPGLDGPALLAAAAKAAPQDFSVLRLLAFDAMQKQQWPQALDALIRLSRYHGDPEASETLAVLIAKAGNQPALAQALMAAAQTDGLWLDRVLRASSKAKVPVGIALPLINKLMASAQLTPALGQYVIRELKREGSWMEASAVWRYLWKRDLPLVFNGNFEQAFVRDGFDWEVADANDHRSGARVALVERQDHGQVLQVDFTGKAIAPPVLRQDLVLFPGQYRLRGTMQAAELRSEQGLAWVVSCVKDGRELGRSTGLKTTGRAWQTFEAEITVPDDCPGMATRLTLQTFAPYEAKTGLRGEVLMDDVTLTRENATP